MVDIQPELAVIHRVLTRKSLFVRKAVGVSGQAQPVAANVDIVFSDKQALSGQHTMDHGKLRLYIHHHTVSHRRILVRSFSLISKRIRPVPLSAHPAWENLR